MSISPEGTTDPAAWKRRGRVVAALQEPPRALAWMLALLAVTGAGCAGRSAKPPALAPQTVSPVAAPEASAPAESEPPPAPERPASAIEKTIVIDPGGDADARPSLVAAAEAERERRSQSQGPTVVITDENLKSKAIGQLTVATPAARDAPAAATDEPAGPGATDEERSADERFWRERILEARRAWRELVDEIDELQSEVNLLRRRFYEEDDPYYRDSQIKPAWDRALDRLRVARLLADEAEDLVADTLEDGRRAGAMPGWMREGIELEPGAGGLQEARPRRRLPEYEPGEPQVYDPDEDDGGDGGR